ncbi:hypothetical protein GPECTOR_15g405 [Gonium pectorale]|uniref:Uncharacterized protein n=1 Tax=Gonium pectorale TaxID=33097 RepID=A0A150GLQ3_GONPE|nr:hypothetical protein GPECTOR_15g405 [Gonium pectorale]|eukprot:KXZ50721.1 hypothetical protein GPECTOR_15g405 [Gonium pectorale]
MSAKAALKAAKASAKAGQPVAAAAAGGPLSPALVAPAARVRTAAGPAPAAAAAAVGGGGGGAGSGSRAQRRAAARTPPPPPPQVAPSPAAPLVRLRIPLEKPVLGLTQLSVCVTSLAEFSDGHVTWLMDSTGTGRDARAAAGEVHYPPGALMPTVLGFDTEFVGDQLALVQLCCRDRALLLRVPQLRSLPSSKQQPQPRNNKDRKRQQQQQRSGAAVSFPPFQCPGQLQALLCDPNIPKAAAEAWQDALMLFAAFGGWMGRPRSPGDPSIRVR